MAIKLWRCLNPACGDARGDAHDFAAEVGVCPKCAIDIDDAKFGRYLVRRQMIHYDPPSRVQGVGEQVRACNMAVGIQSPADPMTGRAMLGHQGTGDPASVNCPRCLETPAWQEAIRKRLDDVDSFAAAITRIHAAAGLPLPRAFRPPAPADPAEPVRIVHPAPLIDATPPPMPAAEPTPELQLQGNI